MFKSDLAAKGWLLKSGDAAAHTHLFLDGGRMFVPDSMHGAFLNLYVNALLRGEVLYLVETRGPLFKLFVDLDARYESNVDESDAIEDLLHLAELIRAAVLDFFVVDCPVTIVTTAPPKRSSQNVDGYKLGIHIHFPGVVVNAPIALAFREHAIDSLRNVSSKSSNPVDDVFDTAVYKGSGLRLLYSSKIGEGREYRPVAVFDRHGKVDAVAGVLGPMEKRQFVHDCSIRVADAMLTPCVSGIDKLADDVLFSHKNVRHGRSVKLDELKHVIPKLQELLPDMYKTVRFTGCFRTEHALMLKTNSRYCRNVEREHRTSTVYFQLSRRGLTQRCFCRKDTHGCSEYCGPHVPVTRDVLDMLLPPEDSDTELKKMVHIMPSRKKSSSTNLHGLLSKAPIIGGVKNKKRGAKKK